MIDLSTCRKAIDNIDSQILDLCRQRMAVARDIAEYKLEHNQKITDKARERDKINTMTRKAAELGISPALIEELYLTMMEHTVAYEQSYLMDKLNPHLNTRSTSVAYLGPKGSYSHLASHRFLDRYTGRIEEHGCSSFDDIVKEVETYACEFGLLPIENSSSGCINQVLDLLQNTKASIVGEIFYPIDHSVLSVPGSTLEGIREIYSHPQPIAQCSHWLKDKLPQAKLCYTKSSSEAMELVLKLNDPHCAAIGSMHAARFFNLNSLATDIANNRRNFTRFIALSMTKRTVPPAMEAKTSLLFTTQKYKPGSLVRVLNEFDRHNINLTKLQSRPLEGGDHDTWQEIFMADIQANLNTPIMQKIMVKLKQYTGILKVLGCYPSNELRRN